MIATNLSRRVTPSAESVTDDSNVGFFPGGNNRHIGPFLMARPD